MSTSLREKELAQKKPGQQILYVSVDRSGGGI
jgi:hypothetical protein